jgi:hypothetical protein
MQYKALTLPVDQGGIDPADVKFFDNICYILSQIPDGIEGVSCHALAQFIENRWGLRRVDGYFVCRGWEHSWNLFRGGRLILDAYPIGGVRPILVNVGDKNHVSIRPWRTAYIPAELDLRGRGRKPSPIRVAKCIAATLRNVRGL